VSRVVLKKNSTTVDLLKCGKIVSISNRHLNTHANIVSIETIVKN